MRQSSHNIYTLLFALLCLLGLGLVWILPHGEKVPSTPTPAVESPSDDLETISLDRFHIMFQYSATYFATTSVSETLPYTVTLLEDIPENHHLSDTDQPPRDGPATISLTVYANPKHLSPSDWVMKNATTSNYSIRKNDGQSIKSFVAAHDAFQFSWSGLYEGESTVIVDGDFAYMFSVTYNSPSDTIRSDFNDILKKISFVIDSSENPSPR